MNLTNLLLLLIVIELFLLLLKPTGRYELERVYGFLVNNMVQPHHIPKVIETIPFKY
jgi:hypothetical protein